jgi:hypothetical protein
MIHRRLDSDWDYTFGNGRGNYLSGVDAVAQAVATRLKLLLGEWWADVNDGLPLWQMILGAPGSAEHRRVVDSLVRERILGTPNVTAIKEMASLYNPDTREYQFAAKIDTAFGQVVIANVPFAPGAGGR